MKAPGTARADALGSAASTPSDVLLALASRCEREEPSRELDRAIDLALNPGASVWSPNWWSGAPDDFLRWPDLLNGAAQYRQIERYTTSLDAAVTLTDWCIAHLSEIGADGLPMCVLTDGTREATGMCLNSPTSGVTALSRALCAAALRALAHGEAK